MEQAHSSNFRTTRPCSETIFDFENDIDIELAVRNIDTSVFKRLQRYAPPEIPYLELRERFDSLEERFRTEKQTKE